MELVINLFLNRKSYFINLSLRGYLTGTVSGEQLVVVTVVVIAAAQQGTEG